MIGNDIVDLEFAAKQSDWKRRGFLEKVFTAKEQQYIREARHPETMVWLLWSMKESAYKMWARQNNKRSFRPIKFNCTLLSMDTGIVHFEDSTVYTKSIINKAFISTVAYVKEDINRRFWIGPGHIVKEKFKENVSKETGIPEMEIMVRKRQNGAPECYYRSQLLVDRCSMSHHGNYGAFVYEY